MQPYLESIVDFLWSDWTPWVLLGMGVLFTIWTRFTQYTAMTHGVQVVRGVYDKPDDPGAINHFQALSAALSATVGLGNIAGVALAIGAGGPGALFWMWIVGVFGMALKTIEITLAMMYRNTDDPDNPHGGAMWVVEKVLGGRGGVWKPVARAIGIFFCITLVISTFTGGNMFQSWSVASITKQYFDVPKLVTGIIMAVVVGLVIIGGIKRIGTVAGKLVPLMCVIYLISAFSVLAMHIAEIPALLVLIVTSAFNPSEATGAFIGGSVGFAFMQGMKRALFSNEAGQGSAPIAHAAAKTAEPAREGIVGGIGPFIDTLCICTVTALVILSTGTHNRDAIGDFKEDISLVQGADVHTWEVEASVEPGALPESKYGPWTAGTKFYLVAEGVGGNRTNPQQTRFRVDGSLKEAAAPGETPPPLTLHWESVVLDESAWETPPTQLKLVSKGVYRNYGGAQLTGHAFDREFLGLGKWLVTLAAWLFAISSMISWSYYGEQGMVYMLGDWSVLPYKLCFLAASIYAANWIPSTDLMEVYMDLGTGAMLWANLPIVLVLGFLAVRCLDDYKRKLKAGEFKRHEPSWMA